MEVLSEDETDVCTRVQIAQSGSGAGGGGDAPDSWWSNYVHLAKGSGCRVCGNLRRDCFVVEGDGGVTYNCETGEQRGLYGVFENPDIFCGVCRARCDHIRERDLDIRGGSERDRYIADKRLRDARAGLLGCDAYLAAGGGNAGTYARKSHICERMAAARCLEPEIDPDHLDVIAAEFVRLELQCLEPWTYPLVRRAFKPGDVPRHRASRDRIAQVLRSLDQRKHDRRKDWTSKYLERWRSVRAYLCALQGEDSAALSAEDAVRVGALFTRLSEVWDEWNPPRLRLFANSGRFKFPERVHFPNYNATFRALFKLLHIEFDPAEWPMPTSEKSVCSINKYLSALFEHLQWPFDPFKIVSRSDERAVE